MRENIRTLSRRMAGAVLGRLHEFASYIPVVNAYAEPARRAWVREQYMTFSRSERRRVMMSIARFAHINRPIKGYYLEFGSHEANSMRLAWSCFRHLFDWTFVAFDSFQGLPEMEDFDRSSIFIPGNLATAEEEFRRRCRAAGMPDNRLLTVKGFYDKSLTSELAARLLPEKAAVIYVDCDLYASTVPVLSFCRDFFQKGTIVVFDDWNCYYGDPMFGERRAWAEFVTSNPQLRFEPFVSTGECQSFVCVSSE